MSRSRKIISMQTGNINRSVRERRLYEESLVQDSGDDLDNIPAALFINSTAKKEYFRVLRVMREKGGIVGDLNRADLLSYSNSYAQYVSCVKQIRKKDFEMVIATSSGPKANPVCSLMDRARREMGESARRLGMTIDGMLKAASVKADMQEAELEQRFGAI